MPIKKCVIVASGNIENMNLHKKILEEADLIICADGGLKYLNEISIDPDIILGDFDSVDENLILKYRKKDIPIFDFPARKDATDSELAIDYAIKSQPKEVVMIGVLGSRLDHTLANMHMLKKFDKHNIKAMIVNNKNEIHFVNKSIRINGKVGDLISIIPITSQVSGVNTSGLEYPLVNETLLFEASRGLSNVFLSEEAVIEIYDGEFFLIKSED